MVIYDTLDAYMELTDEGELTVRTQNSEVGAGLDTEDLLRLIEAASVALRAQLTAA